MFGKLGLVILLLVQTQLVPGLVTMGPKKTGDSARREPRGKFHPGMADGNQHTTYNFFENLHGLLIHKNIRIPTRKTIREPPLGLGGNF